MPKNDPRKDPNSLGNILLAFENVTPSDLEEAIAYQLRNQDTLLGETMIRLKMITQEQLDEAIIMQRKRRGETTELVEYATQRTRSLATGFASLTALAGELTLKLKGG